MKTRHKLKAEICRHFGYLTVVSDKEVCRQIVQRTGWALPTGKLARVEFMERFVKQFGISAPTKVEKIRRALRTTARRMERQRDAKRTQELCLLAEIGQLSDADRREAARIAKRQIDRVNGTDAFISSEAWRKLRYRALALHGNKCQCCGASPETGTSLHVDHIKPRWKYPELALDLKNLQVLCADCNMGKGGWDETDWRKRSGADSLEELPADAAEHMRSIQ